MFERLTQLYLQTVPEYQTKLTHIWTLREVPPDVRKFLALPTQDEGIDFIARTRHGKYWAIQSKFLSQHDKPLTRTKLGTFSSLVSNTCSNIELAVVAHTASKPVSKRHLMRNTTEIGLDRWQSLDQEAWSLIVKKLSGRQARREARSPRPHQRDAISAAKAHFVRGGAARGRLIMPCGTGKSLTAYWIAEALKAKTILVAVPSLALVRQSLTDWTREFLAHGIKLDRNRILNLNSRDLDEAEAQAVGSGIALKRVYKEHAIKHAISFHRSIRAADRFREQQDALNRLHTIGPKTTNLHISSKKTAGQRSDLLREFVGHKRALMTNARCLTEGIDVREIDCVMFADPKQSQIDIVQAAGRALRKYQGKEYGYIVVPLVVPENMEFEKFAETTAFKQVAQTLTALSTQDERIADEFRAIEQGRVSSGKIVEIEGDVPVGMQMKLGDFAEAISTRLWESIGRANWRKFEDARVFVHRLGLKSYTEWRGYYASDKKPADIPANPNNVYANNGWAGMGDWLGTGTVSTHLRQYQSFKKARAFVRGLGLKSMAEWRGYSKLGKKPTDIPANPHTVYANNGWAGMGDWLGTGMIGPADYQFRSFKKARAFVRDLGLKREEEWFAYTRSGKKPTDIPANPRRTYENDGWAGMGDWLGTEKVANQFREYRSFKKARAFVNGLGLKSRADWEAYCKSGKKPPDIPTGPRQTYLEDGWVGYGDWLGTGRRRGQGWRNFGDARAFVRDLGLKSNAEWVAYCKSAKKPADIPSNPNQDYANEGWAGVGDWLGYAPRNSHSEARPMKGPVEAAAPASAHPDAPSSR